MAHLHLSFLIFVSIFSRLFFSFIWLLLGLIYLVELGCCSLAEKLINELLTMKGSFTNCLGSVICKLQTFECILFIKFLFLVYQYLSPLPFGWFISINIEYMQLKFIKFLIGNHWWLPFVRSGDIRYSFILVIKIWYLTYLTLLSQPKIYLLSVLALRFQYAMNVRVRSGQCVF